MAERSIPTATRKPNARPRRSARGRSTSLVGINDIPYTPDEIEFMKAMDQYKRDNRRPFPTWHEVLLVIISLGYRKVKPRTVLPKPTPKKT